jgi:hypothetical protein
MGNKIQENSLGLADLANQLAFSMKIREVYNLPSYGKVRVQKIKPSGVTMKDIATHPEKFIVKILVDNKEYVRTNLKEYTATVYDYT